MNGYQARALRDPIGLRNHRGAGHVEPQAYVAKVDHHLSLPEQGSRVRSRPTRKLEPSLESCPDGCWVSLETEPIRSCMLCREPLARDTRGVLSRAIRVMA